MTFGKRGLSRRDFQNHDMPSKRPQKTAESPKDRGSDPLEHDHHLDLIEGLESGSVALNPQEFRLPSALAETLATESLAWSEGDRVRRLWRADASLWTGESEEEWLGWLSLVPRQLQPGTLSLLRGLTDSLADPEVNPQWKTILLLGMGGSSLGPEVLGSVLDGANAEGRALVVLDSTDPSQVRRVLDDLDLERTLVFVSSKSGSTLETNLLLDFFWNAMSDELGRAVTGSRFIAITDPGSRLEQKANELGFRQVFRGHEDVGGRYSVLSNFGLAPLAALGGPVQELLERAQPMVLACAPATPAKQNPGLRLGLLLGLAARAGRDKVTFFATPGLESLGAWAEQLIAESTGKESKGIVPVDLEAPGRPEHYDRDRLFVALELASDMEEEDEAGAAWEARLQALEEHQHPIVRIRVEAPLSLGQEFFRWEFALAVAGSVLGLDPFDQPDVESSKIRSREITDALSESTRVSGDNSLPESSRPPTDEATADSTVQSPLVASGPLQLFVAEAERDRLALEPGAKIEDVLAAHLGRLEAGDYFAVLAYVDRNDEMLDLLQSLRRKVRNQLKVATTLGFGPRFLHSTGQLHKGGPNTGVFLQVTHASDPDLAIPGSELSFGVVQQAQAQGDLEVLLERGRRVVRVHLSGDVGAGLQRLDGLVGRALHLLTESD